VASELGNIGVVGLATTGTGLAALLASAGHQVIGVDPDAQALAAAGTALDATLPDRDARGRVTTGSDLSALAGCGLVVEAVPEQMARKAAALADIATVVDGSAVLATSAHVLPVTALAVAVPDPSRVVGLRLTPPGPGTGLVEVVRTVATDAQVLADVEALADGLPTARITVADRVGAVTTSLLFPYLNDAVRMLEARYASREDIDAAMRFGCGHPNGPLTLLDAIGLDVALDVLEALYAQTGDHLHAPAPLLRQYVSAGLLGRTSGRGIYAYDASGAVAQDAPAGPRAAAAPREVRAVGVIGTGTMASGIVEVCARAGYDVVFRARGDDKVAAVRKKVEGSLEKAVQKGKLAEDARAEALRRITGTTEVAGLADCDLVIEAVVEDLAVKKALFAELDVVCKPGAVLATTTSSLPVIECAMATSRPQDVVGMHWFNPATVMKLVEVVPTVHTADDVVATVLAVCETTRKHPVVCGDRAGFIVNALLFPYLNDAVRLLERGAASMDEIDLAMTAALGHPMGPFALMDVVGMDVTHAIQSVLHAEFREPGHAPAPSLGALVQAGHLGRKTGRGFRDHSRR
jgi:3-hydroxybutyryl-CoA dehydrogenase